MSTTVTLAILALSAVVFGLIHVTGVRLMSSILKDEEGHGGDTGDHGASDRSVGEHDRQSA